MEIRNPELRFKNANCTWERKCLSEIANRFDNLRIPVKASEREIGEIPYYGANGIQSFVNGFTHEGEFVLLAEDGANDLKNYPIQYVEGKIWVNNHAHVIQGINTNNRFLANALKQVNFEKFLVGGGRAKLNSNIMMDIEITISSDYKEQTQIGNFFKSLDEKIALLEQKHEKLVQLKKAMLDKMFPKPGAKVPEIRFRGFSGNWEGKRLGDVVDIVGGGTPSTMNPDYWDGLIDWYSPTEIGQSVYAYKSQKRITQLGYEKSSTKILPAKKTILFTSRAGIGDMAILMNDATTNQGFQSFIVKTHLCDVYFFYTLGFLIKQFAISNASGSTFLEVSGKILSKMPIHIPSFLEQQKIGEYFEKLDKLISESTVLIDKYKNIKHGLLSKMFV